MSFKSITYLLFFLSLSSGLLGQSDRIIDVLDMDKLKSMVQSLPNNKEIKLINFWASWCIPCMEELPYFEKIKQQFPELKINLINLDFEKDVKTKVMKIIDHRYEGCAISRIQGLSADDWMPVVNSEWSGSIPATLIIKGGKKEFKEGKFKDFEEIKNLLINLQNQ
ncbi:MAG: TlpA disulfide reductase family protein [Saprospiraceae bacterium]